MKSNSYKIQIKQLKTKILRDEISLIDAVDLFSKIIYGFESDIHLDYQKMERDFELKYRDKTNTDLEVLIQDNKKLDSKIAKLTKVLVLQELGITFASNELNEILNN